MARGRLLLVMAWRNVMRRKRRTLITAVTVAGGFVMALTFTGMGDYGYTNMINTSAQMGFGHVTAEPAGYFDSPSLDKRIAHSGELREAILSGGGVQDALVRIVGQGMFATASKSVGGVMIGIDPARESPRRNVFIDTITEGTLFASADEPGVLIGAKLAAKLNLRIGKKMVYTGTDVNGEIVSDMARVTGIFRTGIDAVDGSIALFPIDRLRRALHYAPGDATLVAIFIGDQRKAAATRDALQARLGRIDAAFYSWQQTQAELAGVIAIDRTSNYLFQFFLGLLVAAGILDTILMSVLERKREFGVMLAVGLDPGALFRLVVAESFYIGVLGVLIGALITIPWYWFMYHTGFDLAGMVPEGYDVSGVPVESSIKMRLYTESIAATLAVVFGLTLVSGIYPAWKASRVPPVESMRNV